jgi:hypothetical protein
MFLFLTVTDSLLANKAQNFLLIWGKLLHLQLVVKTRGPFSSILRFIFENVFEGGNVTCTI